MISVLLHFKVSAIALQVLEATDLTPVVRWTGQNAAGRLGQETAIARLAIAPNSA
ncbi:MAG: hypothetical protein IGR92_17915 [Leptolyngbyaceae cyanobacterium T60_A2020_046]|nr:hypothetical protein [Leptolyngbyaceae cyanobacterium T60_A2020_046]